MLKRYVGPESPVMVRIAGREFGTVETGDAIAIPDDLANSVAWPKRNWDDGAPVKQNENEDN